MDEIKADKTEKKITISTINNRYTTDTDINKQINNNGESEDEIINGKNNKYNKYERLVKLGRHKEAKRYQTLLEHGEHERAEQYSIDISRQHELYLQDITSTETQTTIQEVIINNETSTLPRHITPDTQNINEDKILHDIPLTNSDDKPLNKKQIKQNKKAIKEEKKKQRKTPVKPDKKLTQEKVTPRTLKEQGQKI